MDANNDKYHAQDGGVRPQPSLTISITLLQQRIRSSSPKILQSSKHQR